MTDIIIYGKGKTGKSLYKMLEKQNIKAVLYDDKTGFSEENGFTENSVVLLSPGVLPTAKGITEAKNAGCKIISELEYCFPLCKGTVISVTGTNGKTTTCEMIGHILKYADKSIRLLGNGGVPLSAEVLDVDKDEIIVLESSSFQLDNAKNFAPYISVFTNIACDHLDYHGNYENYVKAKINNFIHQRNGYAIFNADDCNVAELSKFCQCTPLYYSLEKTDANCRIENGKISFVLDGKSFCIPSGCIDGYVKHNRYNALAAVLACVLAGVKADIAVEALNTYKLLPHRMQFVGSIGGVSFVDDSKATNVHATVNALDNYCEPLALILGGYSKGESFDGIFSNLRSNVITVAASGDTAKEIAECGAKYGVTVECFEDISLATEFCFKSVQKYGGGIVLMSNACSSFDKFSGYAERGDYFCKVVERLIRG